MKHLIATPALCAALILAGCDQPAKLEAAPWRLEATRAENYQAVFASTLSTVRRCTKPGSQFVGASGGRTVDAEMYSELGYGEIRYGIAAAVPVTEAILRIEKAEGGTRILSKGLATVYDEGSMHAGWALYWAKGGTQCRGAILTAPPS